MARSAAPEQDEGSLDGTGFPGDPSPTFGPRPAPMASGLSHSRAVGTKPCHVRCLLSPWAALARAGPCDQNLQPASTALLRTGRKAPRGKRWSWFWKLLLGPVDLGHWAASSATQEAVPTGEQRVRSQIRGCLSICLPAELAQPLASFNKSRVS